MTSVVLAVCAVIGPRSTTRGDTQKAGKSLYYPGSMLGPHGPHILAAGYQQFTILAVHCQQIPADMQCSCQNQQDRTQAVTNQQLI